MSRPTSVPVVASATRLLQAIPADNLNKLIGELADLAAGPGGQPAHPRLGGHDLLQGVRRLPAAVHRAPGQCAPRPRRGDRRRAAAAPGPGQHRGAGAGAGRTEVGSPYPAHQGSSAFSEVDDLVTSQSANLGCFLHDTANILTNIARAHQPDQPVAGPGLQPVLLRRGRQHRGAGTGQAHDDERVGHPTRRSCAPASSSRRSSRPGAVLRARPTRFPTRLPGAGCVTAFGNGVGPATQPGFTPAAGGHVVAPRHRTPTSRSPRPRRSGRSPAPRTASRPTARASCWCWAGCWCPRCSSPGAPAPHAATCPQERLSRCPGLPRRKDGSSDTDGGRTESHDHDGRDKGQRCEGGRCDPGGGRGAGRGARRRPG